MTLKYSESENKHTALGHYGGQGFYHLRYGTPLRPSTMLGGLSEITTSHSDATYVRQTNLLATFVLPAISRVEIGRSRFWLVAQTRKLPPLRSFRRLLCHLQIRHTPRVGWRPPTTE